MNNSSEMECRAELEITGYNLDVYKISNHLGFSIIKDRRPGDYSIVTEQGGVVKNNIRTRINRWHYQTKQKFIEANDALTELRLAFVDVMSDLLDILENGTDLKVDIYIVIYNTQNRIPPIYIDAQNILFASQLGASIDFDIY